MRRIRGAAVWNVLIALSVAACDSISGGLTAPTERSLLSLPLEATVESRFASHITSAPRVAVTITAASIEIGEIRTGRVPLAYQLEMLSSERQGAGATQGLRLHTRTVPPLRLDEEMPCRLKPGVYSIIEPSTGVTVGILIVYPNCRMEVYTG